MSAAKNENDFTIGPMWKAILRMSVPMILAQVVNVLYSLVDRMYIGHVGEVGSDALTGLGLVMPLVSIVTAFANMIATGGGPLCSIARGEGKKEYAEKIMGNAFTLLMFFSIAMTVIIEIFLRPILFLLGASNDTIPFAMGYARIYIMGTVFVLISMGMNSFINAQGFARVGMLTVLLGAVINIVLDPIFIFALHLGIAGAAWATLIAQFCSAMWAMRFLTGRQAILEFKLANLLPDWKVLGRIMTLGTTGFVMSVTTGLVQGLCNTQLQLYGGDTYIGAMTVINSVREVFFNFAHGFTTGAQPVLGYNYGAKAYDRVKKGIRFVTFGALGYGVAVWLAALLIPETLVRIFNDDPELVAVGVHSMRVYFAMFFAMSLQNVGQSTYVGLGKSRYAITFSMFRKVVLVVPLVLLLPRLGFGADGVFLSEPISDVIGGGACYLTMYLTVYRGLGKEEKVKN